MRQIQFIILFLIAFISYNTKADVKDIWPRIPFNIAGANLCEYRAAYSQTRSEYRDEMISNAQRLLYTGDFNPTQTLITINRMYEQNLAYARRGLGVTLENTFKAFIEQYYRNLKPRMRKLAFNHVMPLDSLINMALRGQQVSNISHEDALKIDLFAYGTYSFSPDCNGSIIVTLSLMTRSGETKTYMGTGPVHTVMSKIASSVFEDYQRTTFPSTIKIGNQKITLIGGFNGDVDKTSYLEEAQDICQTLGARLPSAKEYKFINSYGSWSGGITLGRKIWALKFPNVFVPYFERSPQRNYNVVNEREYFYTCVK